jgi:plasmid stability protein
MKNVTLALPEDVAQWARVWAAKHDTSVSRMLGNMLQERMESERSYRAAQASFLARAAAPLKTEGGYPSREELHER